MEIKLVLDGQATIEEIQELHDKKGYDFIIEDGSIKHVNK